MAKAEFPTALERSATQEVSRFVLSKQKLVLSFSFVCRSEASWIQSTGPDRDPPSPAETPPPPGSSAPPSRLPLLVSGCQLERLHQSARSAAGGSDPPTWPTAAGLALNCSVFLQLSTEASDSDPSKQTVTPLTRSKL
ncbi:hypothetical protein F2P81_009742 [Scophthalmus maximus]|uniref:Uncharacterized protein n=1 Tax=Scophthalmus maximus TaxID=52904 RepID=A0A6A4SXL3_SCOMX|nr:hypothetical protein F2P81_009742 [Scophthalmus maximus]